MPCYHLHLDDGTRAIVCGRGLRLNRCSCGAVADYQCDGANARHRSGTCDAYVCERCRTHVGEDLDLCPACAEAPVQGALL